MLLECETLAAYSGIDPAFQHLWTNISVVLQLGNMLKMVGQRDEWLSCKKHW